MDNQQLMALLTKVVESNTKAMNKNAEASEKLATEVRGLRATIQGAQRKIGGEIGGIIDHQKKVVRELEEEARAVRKSGGKVAT